MLWFATNDLIGNFADCLAVKCIYPTRCTFLKWEKVRKQTIVSSFLCRFEATGKQCGRVQTRAGIIRLPGIASCLISLQAFQSSNRNKYMRAHHFLWLLYSWNRAEASLERADDSVGLGFSMAGPVLVDAWQMGSFKAAERNDSRSIKNQQGNCSVGLLRAQRSITITFTNTHHQLIILLLLCVLFYIVSP